FVGSDSIALGTCGSVRVIAGRLWLRPFGRQFSRLATWSIWVAASVSLVIGSTLAPVDPLFVGLLVGGSLSNALESSLRSSITDYICVRTWAAFNLADLALAAGTIGITCELATVMHQRLA